MKKRLFIVVFVYFILLVALIYRNYGLWRDEIFTLDVITRTYKDGFFIIINDVHPPLYYWLLKSFVDICVYFGVNIVEAAKLFSIFPFILMCIFVIEHLHSRGYDENRILFYLLLLFGTRIIMYAIEIRMYSLAYLFVTMSYLYALDIISTNNAIDWVKFTISSIFAAYTHYYAVICLSLIYFFLLYRCVKNKNIKRWIICFFTTVLSYTPWLFILLNQLKDVNEGWGGNIRLVDLIMFVVFPFYTNEFVSTFLIVSLCLYLCVFAFRNNEKNLNDIYDLLCISNPIYVGFIGLSVSIIAQKFFTGKYMLPGWSVFWFGISEIVWKHKFRKYIISIFLVLQIMTYGITFHKENLDRIGFEYLKKYTTTNQTIYANDTLLDICKFYKLDENIEMLSKANKGDLILFYAGDVPVDLYIFKDSFTFGGARVTIGIKN